MMRVITKITFTLFLLFRDSKIKSIAAIGWGIRIGLGSDCFQGFGALKVLDV
jgi:hypothetical protein